MTKRLLMSDQTLFRNVGVFEIDHIPEQILYRETQLDELAHNVKPGLRGARPMNVICKGLPGTGKTSSVHQIFAEIEEVTDKLVPIYVNCQREQTVYTVFSVIFTKLYGHAPPRTGISIRTLLDEIGKALHDRGIVLVVCLDDVNFLLHDNALGTVLNSLLRIHQDYPGTRVGVIATVSDMEMNLIQELNPWVVSVFCPIEIAFPRYDEDEVRGILQDRIKVGLYPGVFSSEMLNLVVERTLLTGDVRVGLALLKSSVLNAEEDARRMVVAEDVLAAEEYATSVHLSYTMRALNPGERQLLRRVAELSGREEVLTSGALFSSLKGRGKPSYTTFFKRLRKLQDLRLLDLKDRQMGGRTSEIVLRYEPERVVKVCG